MARGVNLWIGLGSLGRDVETRYLPSGDPVASFSIAINNSYKGKDGNKVETTEWVNLVAFKRLAEIAAEYLRKGSTVFVEGKLRTTSYEKNGSKVYRTEVVISELQMLGGKDDKPRAEKNTEPAYARDPRSQFDTPDGEDDIPW